MTLYHKHKGHWHRPSVLLLSLVHRRPLSTIYYYYYVLCRYPYCIVLLYVTVILLNCNITRVSHKVIKYNNYYLYLYIIYVTAATY